jgi:hypothetical protein
MHHPGHGDDPSEGWSDRLPTATGGALDEAHDTVPAPALSWREAEVDYRTDLMRTRRLMEPFLALRRNGGGRPAARLASCPRRHG